MGTHHVINEDVIWCEFTEDIISLLLNIISQIQLRSHQHLLGSYINMLFLLTLLWIKSLHSFSTKSSLCHSYLYFRCIIKFLHPRMCLYIYQQPALTSYRVWVTYVSLAFPEATLELTLPPYFMLLKNWLTGFLRFPQTELRSPKLVSFLEISWFPLLSTRENLLEFKVILETEEFRDKLFKKE